MLQGNTMESCVSANGKALFREQLYEGSISWFESFIVALAWSKYKMNGQLVIHT
jgi:hypothetical protein